MIPFISTYYKKDKKIKVTFPLQSHNLSFPCNQTGRFEVDSWRNSLPWFQFVFDRIWPPKQFGWNEKFLIEAKKICMDEQSRKMSQEKEQKEDKNKIQQEQNTTKKIDDLAELIANTARRHQEKMAEIEKQLAKLIKAK